MSRLSIEFDTPRAFEGLPNSVITNRPIAGQLMRKGPHVTGSLNVVLSSKRVYPNASAADITGQHGEIGNGHNSRRALTVFRHP